MSVRDKPKYGHGGEHRYHNQRFERDVLVTVPLVQLQVELDVRSIRPKNRIIYKWICTSRTASVPVNSKMARRGNRV